ncbi:MAG TPA: HlyD family secretion protein [Bacteroidota bacterium]|nr:HlyD family secretion protein [Bacteroidota bacterium]
MATTDELKRTPPRSAPPPPPEPETEAGDESIEDVPMYRRRRVIVPLAIFIAAALGAGWYWYVNLRGYVTSDDAYIDANRVSISSKILGRVSRLAVDEADSVTTGEVLVTLDSTDLSAQMAQAVAALALARESVTLARVNLAKAQDDFHRADQQFKTAVITKEQYDHARSALDAAGAELGIAVSRIGTAQAQVGVVRAQLDNCTIVSPVNGRVAKRWVLQGDVVQPGQPVFSVYDGSQIWVTANLEETNLNALRLGDDVGISVDSYPDRIFGGKVFQFGGSTAAQFSLIPPNNASGNFTKVTQRVPIKISIEERTPGTATRALLLPGMSVEIRIRTL